MSWYYRKDDHDYGPIPDHVVIDLIESKTLTTETDIRQADWPEYKPLCRTQFGRYFKTSYAPQPPRESQPAYPTDVVHTVIEKVPGCPEPNPDFHSVSLWQQPMPPDPNHDYQRHSVNRSPSMSTPHNVPHYRQKHHNLIYPPNPPRSPVLGLLNLFFPGSAQFIFGQTGKGALWFFMCIFSIPLFGAAFFLVAPLCLIDGFMVGSALNRGKPIGRWAFFP